MFIYQRASLIVLSCLLMSSCVTRVFCSSGSPRLPRRKSSAQYDTTEAGWLSRYVVGQQAKDGFTVESVTKIRVITACGMGLMAPLFTLGLVPAKLPHPVNVTVNGRIDGKQQTRTYQVYLYTLTSTWVAVVPPSFDDRALARGFLGEIATGDPLPQRKGYF